MSGLALRVDGLGKQYRIGRLQTGYRTFREVLTDALHAPFRRLGKILKGEAYGAAELDEPFWALQDVSFNVAEGEVVGIIGRNGAGKTTLLKILSRITEPTEGEAQICGRVGSLLEVGTGFHPELTGRENIYLNGAILGMKSSYINNKLDDIVDFAEIGKFLDTPVKHYSSGMYVRLAFAVAAYLEPDVLLIDEVLAVGDSAFQRKCLGQMRGVAQQGRTILFVSHNMAAVAQLCGRGILLDEGRIVFDGPVDDAIEKYHAAAVHGTTVTASAFDARTGTGKIRFKKITIVNDQGKPYLYSGCALRISMLLEAETPVKASNTTLGIGVNTPYGERLLTLLNKFDPVARASDFEIGKETVIVCEVPCLPLRSDLYFLSFYIDVNGEVADRLRDALCVEIHSADYYETGIMPAASQGPLLVPQRWSFMDDRTEPQEDPHLIGSARIEE